MWKTTISTLFPVEYSVSHAFSNEIFYFAHNKLKVKVKTRHSNRRGEKARFMRRIWNSHERNVRFFEIAGNPFILVIQVFCCCILDVVSSNSIKKNLLRRIHGATKRNQQFENPNSMSMYSMLRNQLLNHYL